MRILSAAAVLLCSAGLLEASGQDEQPQADQTNQSNQEQAATERIAIEFPLGKSWIYRRVDDDGKPDSERPDDATQVVGVHLLDGQQWMAWRELGFGIWSRVDEEGLHEALVEHDEETELLKFKESHLFMKYPTEVGDKLNLSFSTEEDNGYRTEMRTIELNKSVTVPAGTYQCVVYELWQTDPDMGPQPQFGMRYYLDPRVGVVRIDESLYDENGGFMRVELVKIEPGA